MGASARAARLVAALVLASGLAGPGAFGLDLMGGGEAEAAEPVRFTTEDMAAREAVRQARHWQVRKAQEAGVTPRIATARHDLDGDGLPEIIAVLQAPDRCAAMGLRNCPLIILHQPVPGRFLEVGSFFGDAAQLLDSRSQGWLDLETRFTRGPWRRTSWNGLLYRLKR